VTVGGVVVALAVQPISSATASPTAEAAAPQTSVTLTGSPGVPAIDTDTNTVYVPVQAGGVDVLNAATCNATVRSGCSSVTTSPVGSSPLAVAIDEGTDTVYLPNADGTVSVLDGARCNAKVTAGCDQSVATIKVGGFLNDAAFDPSSRTLYLTNGHGGVFVVNAADCNASTTAGCGQRAKEVTDTSGPQAVDIDIATDTVYATNNGTGNGDTISVIDGATCNGANSTGCSSAPATVKVGSGAFWSAVDQANDTIYVANNNDGTVSVINGAACNSHVTSGCGHVAAVVRTGAGPAFVSVDYRLHTLFTVNANDDTLSEINTNTCSAMVRSGCPTLAPSQQAGPDQGTGFNPFPGTAVLDPAFGSAYIVAPGGGDVLSVLGIDRCNAVNTSGCRVLAPNVPDAEFSATIDTATHTIYAGNANLPEVDVLNDHTCRPGNLSRCTPVAKIPVAHAQAELSAVDSTTHTLYASDTSGRVVVINTAKCNAADTGGCRGPWPSMDAGPVTFDVGSLSGGGPALNPATSTLYVPFGVNADEVAVFDVASCNAGITSGCGQHPGVVHVGPGTTALAVDPLTGTVYAVGSPGGAVSVINGAKCNGMVRSGCAHLAATIPVGTDPVGVAVDAATHTTRTAIRPATSQ
jgi:DNA-binding beta-propeller fold protein YncE